jgi:hypothetical protein
MFARVNYNRSIRHTLGYNERKLRLGKAECILAENFLKDVDVLSRKDKLYRFERLNVLNEKAKANTLHISLSFHPSDRLDNDQMKELARQYMEKLHLDHQPYLAYRHRDTGHPHMHLVSTLIQPDGSRLKLDDILRYQSLRITREMEQRLSLVPGYRPPGIRVQKRLREDPPTKVLYGQPGRKEAVEHVLDHVVNNYHYTSLVEFNTALRLYNVRAKIVWEKDTLKPRGLMYHTLDEKGHSVGVSFKSSSFDSQPTLKKLDRQFALNQSLHREELRRLPSSIDWALAGKSADWEGFRKSLLKEKIHAVLDKGTAGEWKNIYYVDMNTRCAFDGNSLGGRYSSESVQARCESAEKLRLEQTQKITNHFKLKHRSL